jgi:LacI family transcriptional regulator
MNKQDGKNKRKRPSLRTVAEHVGLSATTVSLALRGDRSIPQETRERITAAAKTLNYNYVSRAKKEKEQRLFRLVYVINDYGDEPVTANPFYGYILTGAEQACRKQNASLSFLVLLHTHPESEPLPPVLLHDLDGILLASPYPRALVKRIEIESKRPVVLVDNVFPDLSLDSVMADDYGGGYLVTKHLIDLGHKEIRMITGRTQNPEIPPSFRERYRGYRSACLDAGIKLNEAAILSEPIDPPSTAGVKEALKVWLEQVLAETQRPTAVFCAADFFAVSIMRILAEMGINVPEEISVVGFDDFHIATAVIPQLTTVHTYKRSIAQVAVDRLLARIRGDDTPPLNITIQTELKVRQSTARMSE